MPPGLTTALPPAYVKLTAPEGFIVNEFPAQIDPLLTVMVGFGMISKVAVFVAEQNPFDPDKVAVEIPLI